MAKKKQTTDTPLDPPALITALVDAGYELLKFKRKGARLEIRVRPALLLGEDDNFKAMDICMELGLQADCRVFTQTNGSTLFIGVEGRETVITSLEEALIKASEPEAPQPEIEAPQPEIEAPQPEIEAPQAEIK